MTGHARNTGEDHPPTATVDGLDGAAPGDASPLTRAAVVEAVITTTASAATAVGVLGWVVPLCFVC